MADDVKREEFDELKSQVTEGFAKIIGLMKEKPKTAEEAKKIEAKIAEEKTAEPNNLYIEPVHPDWIADAKLKLGDQLERCEVDYPKNGHPRYTVVIKNEFSNASKSHLEYYKIDRRTTAVTNGIESVKAFNTLVAQNLRLNPKKLE